MTNNFKQDIDNRLEGLSLSPQLRQRIVTAAKEGDTEKNPLYRRRRPSRVLLTASAACLTVVFGIRVAAGAFPSFESFLSHMGEDLRGIMQPLDSSAEFAGIRAEVVAAVNDGTAAAVYLTLQDTQGNRINETTELLTTEFTEDSNVFFINASQVHFDSQTNTATYLFSGEALNYLDDRPITLRINGLLNGGVYHDSVDTGLTIADIQALNATPKLELPEEPIGNFSTTGDHAQGDKVAQELKTAVEENTLPLLTKGNPSLQNNQPEWMPLSAAGIVEGTLHLKYEPSAGVAQFNSPEAFLTYPGYTPESSLAALTLSLGEPEQIGYRSYFSAYETVLSLPPNIPPEDIHINARGYVYADYIKGNWQTNFQLEQAAETIRIVCDLDMDGWQVSHVTVSPVGITAFAKGEMSETGKSLEMEVYDTEGNRVETTSGSVLFSDEGGLRLRSAFGRPVNLNELALLKLNGKDYPLHNTEK